MQRRVADEPFAEPDARHLDLLAVLHGELHLELAALLVEQQDAERAVVDHALASSCAMRANSSSRSSTDGDVAADLGERLERVGVARGCARTAAR